ncbi:hypothetical protein JCM17823_07800 [Halorubrum gandharaense]
MSDNHTDAPTETAMTHSLATDGGQSGERERVLVPLKVLEGDTVVEGLAELLSTADVVLLGYHVVPEQTPPEQMREQYEKRGLKSLSELAETFRDAGGDVETRLVFGREREAIVDRVQRETGATAVLHPHTVAGVDSLLVPLYGDVDPVRIARFVANVRGDRDISVTLLGVAEDGDEREGESLVDTAAATLVDAGVPDAAVERHTVAAESLLGDASVDAIIDAAADHDAVVLGERASDWRSLVFGEFHERVAAESLGPVLVVHRRVQDVEE